MILLYKLALSKYLESSPKKKQPTIKIEQINTQPAYDVEKDSALMVINRLNPPNLEDENMLEQLKNRSDVTLSF